MGAAMAEREPPFSFSPATVSPSVNDLFNQIDQLSAYENGDEELEVESVDDGFQEPDSNSDEARDPSVQSPYRPFLHISVSQLVVGVTSVAHTMLRRDEGGSLYGKHINSLFVNAEDRSFLAAFVKNQVGFASVWAKRESVDEPELRTVTVHAAEGSIDLELCFQRKEVPTWGCDPTAPKTLVVEMGVKKQDGELDEEVRQMPAGRRPNLCHRPYEFHDVENEGEEGADPAPLPTDLESHIDAWVQQPLVRLDAHGTIIEWSEALEMVTSYRSEHVVELNIHQLAPTFKTNAWGWQKCLKKLQWYGSVDASTFTNRVEMGLVLNGRYGTSRLIPVEFSGEPSWMEMRIPDSQWGSVAAQWKAVHTTMEEDAISQYVASNPQVTSKVRRKLERRRTYVQTKLAESKGWTAKIDYAAEHSIGIEHYTYLTDSLPEAERGRMPAIGSEIDVRDRETQEAKRIPFEATAGKFGTVLVTAFGCGAGKSYQKMESLYKREIAEADAK